MPTLRLLASVFTGWVFILRVVLSFLKTYFGKLYLYWQRVLLTVIFSYKPNCFVLFSEL